MSPQPLIRVRDLWKTYRMGSQRIHALRGITFEIQPGQYVAIMGPSGSGKSTLMHLLGCLDTPTRGEYFLNGKRVDTIQEDELASIRNRDIGFVFQTFHLMTRATALQNVELPLIYRSVPARKRRLLARRALAEVDLEDRCRHRPAELSGGQRQRVAIARALVNDPLLLLADEPTGNLDSQTGVEIISLFEVLHRRGRTIVLVTHEERIARRAQRIIRLRDGGIQNMDADPVPATAPDSRAVGHSTGSPPTHRSD